jgi:hypothetical protein
MQIAVSPRSTWTWKRFRLRKSKDVEMTAALRGWQRQGRLRQQAR